MTYGSADGVAAFVPRYANKSGRFDNVTVPTLDQVDEWREQVSALLDVALATNGLPAPAADTAVVAMLDGFVNANVGGLVRGVNGQGRYAERPTPVDEMLLTIADAALVWVRTRATGIAALIGLTSEAGAGATAGSRLPTRQNEYTRYPGNVMDYTVSEWL